MKTLTVIFDGECRLCRRCCAWLQRQPSYVRLEFMSLQSDELESRFPGIGRFRPDRDIAVVDDEGNVYSGGAAWIVCLWALREYRQWSWRLAGPALLPLVRRFCGLVADNRMNVSFLLGLKPDTQLRRVLEGYGNTEPPRWPE